MGPEGKGVARISITAGLGCKVDWGSIGKAVIKEAITESKSPGNAIRKIIGVIKDKFRGD
jgi:hypothetical protein